MKLKLGVIGFFFCLIAAVGFININDTQQPVPLPIDGAFSIQGKSNLSNQDVYQTISNLATSENVDIYKPIVQSSGQVAYLTIDESNQQQLQSAPIVGMYYTLGQLDTERLKPLTNTGLQVVYMAYPWYIGGMLQFSDPLRVLLMVSIYLTLLVVLIVVRTRQIKEGVIRRSLGLAVYDLGKDYLTSFIFELVLVVAAVAVYSHVAGGGVFTYSSKLFFAMLLTNLILFQLVDSISVLLFWLTIRLEKPIEIIKNKAKNQLLFIIWLGVIASIIVVSGIFLRETKISQARLTEQIKQLEPWKEASNWKRLELLGLDNEATHAGDIDNGDHYLALAKALKSLDFLYIKPSTVYLPDYMADSPIAEEFAKMLQRDGITNPDVNKQLVYINQTGAKLQNKVNGTDYRVLDHAIATIYIPQQFEKDRASIENTVIAEQFTRTDFSKEDLAVTIIPNGQTIFYFNEYGDNNHELKDNFPLENATDSDNNIVVVLNTDQLIDNKAVALASNIIYSSLYSPKAVKAINDLSGQLHVSINPVDVYQIVTLNIQSLEHQIFLSTLLQKLIYGIVFLLIYQYIQLFIASKQNDFVKKIILGLSKPMIALSSLSYFLATITLVILLTFVWTKQLELILIGISALIASLLSIVISFKKLSDRYTQLLKGDD